MEKKKSLLEEAMLDAKKIQQLLDTNSKEILRNVAKEEINALVRESIVAEDDFTEDDVDDETGSDEVPESPEIGDEGSTEEPIADEPEGSDITGDIEDTPAPEAGSEMDAFDDMDLTGASDDDVIAIYKKLSGTDEIEVVGDDLHLNVSEPGEYIIPGAAAAAGSAPSDEMSDDFNEDDYEDVPTGGDEGAEPEMTDDGEDEYEISMDDEEPAEDDETVSLDEETDLQIKNPKTNVPGAKQAVNDEGDDEIEEQISVNRVAQNRAGGDLTKIKGPGAKQGAGLSESKAGVPVAKYKAVLAQAAQLQKENNEFRDVLKRFRDQLLESAVHNSNLTYIVKLFSEHATKPEEKLTIIERFDNEVSSLTESKKLYRTISKELKAKPITEGITSSQALTSGASGLLKEATVYEDETMKRQRKLMGIKD